MFGTYRLIAVIGLPLLVVGCSEESSPPSGPHTEPPPRAAVRALTTDQSRFQLREVGAAAGFFSIDPTGCVGTDVFVFGAERRLKSSPGKPTEGPLAVVQVFQIDFCSGTLLRDVVGVTEDASLGVDRAKLAEARLQATITGTDFITDTEVQVEVDVTWAGTGDLAFSSQQARFRQPGFLLRFSFKGSFREATASGTVSLTGENLTPEPAFFADLFRARSGELFLVRTQ
jgi:hypothetical protein